MRIGELATRTGTTVETIRFYEARGLMPAAQRESNNYRVYGERHFERLQFIRHCRQFGLSLEEIERLVAFEENPGEHCEEVHGLVEEHISQIALRIGELESLRERLLELQARCSGHESRHCGILRSLREEQETAGQSEDSLK